MLGSPQSSRASHLTWPLSYLATASTVAPRLCPFRGLHPFPLPSVHNFCQFPLLDLQAPSWNSSWPLGPAPLKGAWPFIGTLCGTPNYNPIFPLFICLLRLFQLWLLRVSLGWLLCLTASTVPFLSSSLYPKMIQTNFVFPLPHPRNQSPLYEALVPFIEEWCLKTKIWTSDVLIA